MLLSLLSHSSVTFAPLTLHTQRVTPRILSLSLLPVTFSLRKNQFVHDIAQPSASTVTFSCHKSFSFLPSLSQTCVTSFTFLLKIIYMFVTFPLYQLSH